MTRRRVLGMLLIATSLVSFVAAVLDLSLVSRVAQAEAPLDSFLSRSTSAFWLAAGCLVLAALPSVASPDRVGTILGRTSLGLAAAHVALLYVAGRSGAALLMLATIAFTFSVLVTILGWHLVMAPEPGTGGGVG